MPGQCRLIDSLLTPIVRTNPISRQSPKSLSGQFQQVDSLLNQPLSGKFQLLDSLRNQLSRQFHLVENLQNQFSLQFQLIVYAPPRWSGGYCSGIPRMLLVLLFIVLVLEFGSRRGKIFNVFAKKTGSTAESAQRGQVQFDAGRQGKQQLNYSHDKNARHEPYWGGGWGRKACCICDSGS